MWTWCCPALCGRAERVCEQADPGVQDYGSNQEEVFLCNSKPGSQALTSPGEGEAAPRRSADPAGLAVPEPKTNRDMNIRSPLPIPVSLSLSMSSWLSYNSLCRQNWPQTQGSACLCLLGAKVVRHNTCPIPPMVSFTSQTGARTSRGTALLQQL